MALTEARLLKHDFPVHGTLITFFVFETLSVTFWSLFSDASVTFFVAFCQTAFAGLLLRQGDILREIGAQKSFRRKKTLAWPPLQNVAVTEKMFCANVWR